MDQHNEARCASFCPFASSRNLRPGAGAHRLNKSPAKSLRQADPEEMGRTLRERLRTKPKGLVEFFDVLCDVSNAYVQ